MTKPTTPDQDVLAQHIATIAEASATIQFLTDKLRHAEAQQETISEILKLTAMITMVSANYLTDYEKYFKSKEERALEHLDKGDLINARDIYLEMRAKNPRHQTVINLGKRLKTKIDGFVSFQLKLARDNMQRRLWNYAIICTESIVALDPGNHQAGQLMLKAMDFRVDDTHADEYLAQTVPALTSDSREERTKKELALFCIGEARHAWTEGRYQDALDYCGKAQWYVDSSTAEGMKTKIHREMKKAKKAPTTIGQHPTSPITSSV